MRTRRIARLKSKLDRGLLAYTSAALGTAGVVAVPLAPPAEAKVIYTHVKVTITADHNYNLDLNNDGKSDFQVHDHVYGSSGTEFSTEYLDARPMGKNEVVTSSQGRGFFALALKSGQHIGPRKHFWAFRPELAAIFEFSGSYLGYWVNVKHRYLGLKFHFNGHTHYGWARLTVQLNRFLELTSVLSGYAYETVPDKSIIAGDEGTGATSLGDLALGAAGRKQNRHCQVAGHSSGGVPRESENP